MKALGDLAKVITFVLIFQNRKRDLFGDALRRVLREPMSGKKVAGGNPAETQQQDPVAKPKVFATRRLGLAIRLSLIRPISDSREALCWPAKTATAGSFKPREPRACPA
jgi:hypothetical protein